MDLAGQAASRQAPSGQHGDRQANAAAAAAAGAHVPAGARDANAAPTQPQAAGVGPAAGGAVLALSQEAPAARAGGGSAALAATPAAAAEAGAAGAVAAGTAAAPAPAQGPPSQQEVAQLRALLARCRAAGCLDLQGAARYRVAFCHRLTPTQRQEDLDVFAELAAAGELGLLAECVREAVAALQPAALPLAAAGQGNPAHGRGVKRPAEDSW
ncbi:hypothetical protein ABPG75_004794 [Micractinium tetrahymenae]